MKLNTLLSATIAALIGFGTGAMALLTATGVDEIADIRPLSWTALGVGSMISFLKDCQAMATSKRSTVDPGRPDGV